MLRRPAPLPALLALLLATAGGCHRAGAVDGPAPRAEKSCPKPTPPPVLAPPPALEPVTSHVTLEASVTEARLRQELARELPETLTSGQRTVGPGIRVSYVVKRGALSFELKDDLLYLVTRVNASATACKTLGPLCPTLGSCGPQVAVRAGVPLVLKDDYTFPTSDVDVKVERGCTIAGFDATGEIQKAASREAGSARREIERSLPAVHPHAQSVWQELHRSLALDGGACLRVVPTRVLEGHPKLASGVLSTRASLTGTLAFERPCADGAPPAATPLAPLELVDDVPEGVALRAPLRLSWDEVSKALQGSLGGELALNRVVAQGALIDSTPRVVLELERDDEACGPVWLSAEPWFDATHDALRLRQVSSVGDAKPRRKLEELARRVEASARVPLPIALADLRHRLDEARRELVPTVDEAAVEVVFDAPTVSKVELDTEGLVPIVSVAGKASVKAE